MATSRKRPTRAKSQVIEQIGRVSNASVLKGSGRGWHEWIEILEKVGARAWTHQETTAWLKKKYGLRPWWQQGVTHGFEVHIGRRIDGVGANGIRSLTATKTMPVSAPKLWKFLTSPAGLALWLKPLSPVRIRVGAKFETTDGFFGEIRTLRAGEKIRCSWRDSAEPQAKASYFEVYVIPRPVPRSTLIISHGSLREARAQTELRARWKQAAAAIRLSFGD